MPVREGPDFESLFGAALFVCGITWAWDWVSSIYFPGQTALNLTLFSALVYTESAFLGAFGLSRRYNDRVAVGLRVGLGAFLTNTVFRMIVFDIVEALWGVVVYFLSFMVGGLLGGLLTERVFDERPTPDGSGIEYEGSTNNYYRFNYL